jgi:hypothetical protein
VTTGIERVLLNSSRCGEEKLTLESVEVRLPPGSVLVSRDEHLRLLCHISERSARESKRRDFHGSPDEAANLTRILPDRGM